MPSNKFVRKLKKSREFRNRSKSNDNKDVTMYVGAIDIDNENGKVHVITPVKEEEFNYRSSIKEDSSKIIMSPKVAARLNRFIEE
jgi:hypothetical protein